MTKTGLKSLQLTKVTINNLVARHVALGIFAAELSVNVRFSLKAPIGSVPIADIVVFHIERPLSDAGRNSLR